MSGIPLFVVTGFIGSGKTTLLKLLTAHFTGKQKVGVIQCELPFASTDSGFTRHREPNFSLLEVNRGSVSCTNISENVIEGITEFINKEAPELLFLEAPGLSETNKIVSTLCSDELTGKVIFCGSFFILDASRFDLEVTHIKTLRNQIRLADTVLVNKYDKLSRLESHEVILKSYNFNRVLNWIKLINPFASVCPTIYSSVPDEVLSEIESKSKIVKDGLFNPVTFYITEDYIPDDAVKRLKVLLKHCESARGYLKVKNNNIAFNYCNKHLETKSYTESLPRSEIIISGYHTNFGSIWDHLYQ